jgi:hypothetical protein
MTVCGKHGKTIKPFSHPSHKPWKSLRDSHIPSALRLIIFTQFSNQKRSLPQLPIPLPFRLIFQLEKTEGKKISLVTTTGHCFFVIAQRSSWTEPGRRSREWMSNLRMLDSIATRRHLFWISFLGPFPLPERARMSGRHRRYLLAPDRQDMPSRIASTASTRLL